MYSVVGKSLVIVVAVLMVIAREQLVMLLDLGPIVVVL